MLNLHFQWLVRDSYDHANGSFIGSTDYYDIAFPISFNNTTLSILKNQTYIAVYNDSYTNVYRDSNGNDGWNNSKMTLTADYRGQYWPSVFQFFTLIGF